MCRLYIDGENFMFKVANILKANELIEEKSDITKFKISYFKKILSREGEIANVYFYCSRLHRYTKSKTLKDKSETVIQSQRRLKRYLTSDGIDFIIGGNVRLQDYMPEDACHGEKAAFKEKGVDVRLAVDVITDVFHERTTTVLLASSDSDMMPVVQEVQRCGAKIVYVGFAANPNKGLKALCDETILLRDEDVVEAFKEANANGED